MTYLRKYKPFLFPIIFAFYLFGSLNAKAQKNDFLNSLHEPVTFPVKSEGKWTLIDTSGSIIDSAIVYDSITQGFAYFHLVSKNQLWGLINQDGKILVPLLYDSLFIESDYLVGKHNNKFDFYDLPGFKLKNQLYTDQIHVNGQYLITQSRRQKGLARPDGKRLLPDEYLFFLPMNKYLLTGKTNRYGLYDIKSEKEVLPAIYHEIKLSEEHVLKAWNGKYWIYVFENNLVFDPHTLGWVETCNNDYFKFHHHNNQQIELYRMNTLQKVDSHGYENFFPQKNGDIVVKKGNKIGYCDSHFNLLIPCQYQHLSALKSGLLLFEENKHFGLMKRNGEIIISAKFNDIQAFTGYQNNKNQYLVFLKNKVGLINSDGKQFLPCQYDHIAEYSNCYILQVNRKFGLANKEGKIILPAVYDFYGFGGKDYYQTNLNNNRINNLFLFNKNNKWQLADNNGLLSTNYYDDIVVGQEFYNVPQS